MGPRATPTIRDGRVFTVGATGILNALRLENGERLWSHRVLEENGSSNLSWGTSGSPLLDGDRVVVSAGGREGRSLVAYRADTGEAVWATGHDQQSYSSATIATLAGRRQILIFNGGSVAGHDASTGALLWEQPWPAEQPNVAQPLPLSGDRVLFSAGYGVGSKLYQIAAAADGSLSATLLWESPRLKAKFTNVFFHDGFLYGLDDGVFTCLDPEGRPAQMARRAIRPRSGYPRGGSLPHPNGGRRAGAGRAEPRGPQGADTLHGLRRQDLEPARACGQPTVRAHRP